MFFSMLDKLAKDSAYIKEYHDFVAKLQRFHDGKRSSFTRVPSFGGKDLDLLLLYKTVTSLGGFSKVTDEKKWPEVAKCLNLPLKCTNGAFALRQHYIRYLEHYERVFFFGEDSEDAAGDLARQALGLPGLRTPQPASSVSIPGHHDTIKPPTLGPLGELKTHNFTRLMFSLASGLPNEVDFALNICTLLSNVSNSIFNLAKAPGIVDLMLLHAGVWTTDTVNAQDMYKEWYQESDRDFVKFWREALDDNCAKELFESGVSGTDVIEKLSANNEEDERSRTLFADCTIDVNHAETNRVLQICVILHNFSLEDLNAMFLSTHKGARRFLLLCAGTRQSTLRRIALDTLDNLADRFELTRLVDQENQKLLQIIHNFLESKDRLRRVRAMTILAKLASCEDNEEILSEGMTLEAYESLIKALTIPDIQMILASLDSLYFLSHLGEATSTSIAMVYGAIDVLICLVTVQAESYGNRAIAGFRIVENKNSIYSQKHQGQQRALKSSAMRHAIPQSSHSQAPQDLRAQNFMRSPFPPVRPLGVPSDPQRQSMPQQQQQQQQPQPDVDETEEIDAEVFTAQWISAFYELNPGHIISRSDMYSDYLVTCNRLGRLGILPASNFNKILRMVIPEQHLPGAQTNLEGHYNISGVRRRATPLPVQSRVPKQRASVPVVGLHGNSPRLPGAPSGLPQNQRMPVQGIRVQRPLGGPFLPGQPPPLSPSEGFQPPRIRHDFPPVQVRPGFPSGPPNLSGPGPAQGPSAIQTAPQPLPLLGPRAPSVSGESRGETTAVSTTSPIALEAAKSAVEAPPNVAITPSSAPGMNQANPLPPGTISLPFSPTGQGQGQDGVNQYQTAMEHIKRDMQQHYIQFHLHRQQIQNIQIQLQQAVQQSQGQQLPQNVMEDIQTRVHSHHAQMQLHYQKLQQLPILMQQVQQKASQEQQAAKESTPDVVPASPKSKRNKKNQSGTPKQVPAHDNTAQQQCNQFSPMPVPGTLKPTASLPSLPGAINAAPLTVQQIQMNPNWKPEISQGQSGVPSGASQGSMPLVPPNSLAVINGIQSINKVQNVTDNTHGKGSLDPSNVLPMNFLASPGVGSSVVGIISPQQASLATSFVRPAMTASPASMPITSSQLDPLSKSPARPVGLPPMPPPSQAPPGQVTFQSPLPPTSIVGTGAQQSARFMVVHGPPQGMPPNGTQRGFPPNAMVMMSPVGAQPFASPMTRFPPVTNQATPNNVRQQLHVGRENATLTSPAQPVLTPLPTVMLQGSFQPVSTQVSAHQQVSISSPAAATMPQNSLESTPATTITYPSTANQRTATEIATVNDRNGSDSISTSSSNDSKVKCIPVHQQNGSTHVVGKRQNPQNNASDEDLNFESKESGERSTVITTLQPTTLSSSSSLKSLNTLAKSNEDRLPLTVTKPVSHVEQAKRLCDDLFAKDGLENDCKRLKLAAEVNRLESQEKNSYVLNGVLDNKLLQKHEKGSDKNEVWLNGLHTQNALKNRENGLSKHIESISENGIDCQTLKNPLPNDIGSKVTEDSNINSKELEREKGKEVQSEETPLSSEDDPSSMKLKEKNEVDAVANSSGGEKDASRDMQCDSPTDSLSKSEGKDSVADLTLPGQKVKQCHWEGCSSSFSTSSNLLSHMVCAHAPVEGQLGICRIPGCSSVQRPRGSMICHFQQRHCSPSGSGDDLPLVTLPELLFPKVADVEKKEDESPVTRSVRLTSALILRNIARNSSYGRQLIRAYESRLVSSAMSTSEASSAMASCLAELSKTRTSRSSFSEEDS